MQLLLTAKNEGNSLPPWGLEPWRVWGFQNPDQNCKKSKPDPEAEIGATASMCSYLFRRDQEESGSGSLGHKKEMKHRGAAPLQGLCSILILVQNVEDFLDHNFLLLNSPLAASQRMHFKPFSARKCCQPS